MEKQKRFALPLHARKAARNAIVTADGWEEYRKSKGINASSLSGEVLFDAADALGINVRAALGADNRATAGKLFGQSNSPVTPAAGPIDWQRIREISREEISLRLQPTVIERQIIITPQRRIETGDMIKHPAFDKLLAACNVRDFSGNRLNVYLYGPTGTGKTYAAGQVAQLMGLEFYFHSTAQEAYDLLGYEKVSGELLVTPFVTAFEHGGVVLLDEMDRYDPKALTVVNAALANGKLTLPNGKEIKRHPDFICIAAGNTNGMGATADFTAAETLDKSTLSRFPVKLAWGVDPALESRAAEQRSQNSAVALLWLEECRHARKVLDRLGLPEVADQRCVEAGANMLAAGLSLDDVRDLTYLAGWADDQRRGILDGMAGKLIRNEQLQQGN